MNDTRRWHASWIISAIIALLVALCASGTNLEMAPLITITVLGWLLATALIWVTTANDRHIKAKMVSSGALFILAGFAIYWIHTNDRPIMRPQIEVVQSKSLAGNRFALAICSPTRGMRAKRSSAAPREETDGEFQRAKHLARGGLTNIQVPPVREIPKRKMPLSSELRF
jgi:hypothetical protein